MLLNVDPYTTARAIRVGNMKLIHGSKEAGKHGTWVPPAQNPQFASGEVNSGIRCSKKGSDLNDFNPAPSRMFRSSKLEAVLKSLGRDRVVPHPAVVHCGEKPSNASTNCDPLFSYCLYDISKDPCEYNNLAKQLPDVVSALEKRLSEYKESMVVPRNRQPDPNGNPDRFDGVWTPWVDVP